MANDTPETRYPEPTPLVITQDMLAERAAAAPPPVDFERGMCWTPAITLGMIVLNICFFIPVFSAENPQQVLEVFLKTGLIREKVLAGEIWRLLTSMFMHVDLSHLLGNMAALYIVGMACEHAFGPWQTVLIFLLTGLCGGFVSLLVHPGPSLGASGAVFGVLGCAVGFFWRHRRAVHLRDKRIGLALLAWAVYQIVIGLTEPMIDNAAHVAGLLAGLVLGCLLPPRLLSRPEPPDTLPSAM
ncbi:MAG: rhomboid family intramembrane serine protease [Thermogutta sp.]|uniref:rhomboid family intramembrane serine protease n=1 Tax=Thermogutta sp. TaxID=1962930 RepID=UPI0019AB98F9|nr:rhomboid family intramembrane serine protease [Thermogutta sp.]MBC7352473.1 rhomboid family intramembrane serine protease [Thermogutta sp.]